MLLNKNYDHRISRKDFYQLVNDKTDSIAIKMIDFSNIVELKEMSFTRFGQVITGKVAEITNAVAHWDYFPAEMLHQFWNMI